MAFEAAGVLPAIARETFEFVFSPDEDPVQDYAENFGPFVIARRSLEPQGRG